MESDISLRLARTKISFKRMIYTSNKKYPFYMSHSYGLPRSLQRAAEGTETTCTDSTHRNSISDRDKGKKY
jgi:hypothetical protein